MTSLSGNASSGTAAQAAAKAAIAAIPAPGAQWVEFGSRGVVLVTGSRTRVMGALAKLPPPVRIVAFVPDAAADAAVPNNVRLVRAPILSLTGYLGCFAATSVPVNGVPVDAGKFGWNADHRFDLVLDLTDEQRWPSEVGPYGYFAPHTEPDLEIALAHIRSQPATWRKPRFFDYREHLCAHGAAGVTGCTRCLDVCPAGAITSVNSRLQFDPHLCQGCGTCALVCPDGAVRYAYPPADITLERLRAGLAAWSATEALPPRLIVSASLAPTMATTTVQGLSPRDLLFDVPALASFGIEAWVAALAWGAVQVVLIADSRIAHSSVRALREELAVAHAILSALGETADRIVVTDVASIVSAVPLEQVAPVAGALAGPTKRSTLYAAIDHLNASSARSKQAALLPPRAPFGAVAVRKDRCTLCFACVNLCPTRALTSDEASHSALRFVEARCVQCGLCEHGCPEQAIALQPQIQLDCAAREESTTLCVDEPFPCVRCGTGFITRRMLARSMELMKDHPQLLEHGSGRLKLCPACRAQATLQDLPAEGS